MARRPHVGVAHGKSGPLVVADRKVVARIVARDPALLVQLKKARFPGFAKKLRHAGVARFGDWLVLPGGAPMTWIALGRRSGAFVRALGHRADVDRTLTIDVAKVRDDAWKLGVAKLDVVGAGARVMVDAACGDLGPLGGKPVTVPVALPAGRYMIDHATQGKGRAVVAIYRLRPGDEPVARRAATKKPAPVRWGPSPKFVGTDGLPVLAIPTVLLPGWKGLAECDLRDKVGTIPIGRGQGLLLASRFVALVPTPDGALLLWFTAGDHGSQIVELVRAAPAKAWKKQRGTFTMTGDTLALIDPADYASKTRGTTRGKLAAGTYAIELLDEQRSDAAMARAVRLRKR